MPTSLQYPLERSRGLQQKWARLLQQEFAIVANTILPRDHDDEDACGLIDMRRVPHHDQP